MQSVLGGVMAKGDNPNRNLQSTQLRTYLLLLLLRDQAGEIERELSDTGQIGDNINNPNTVKFLNILSNRNLSQHITESTHIAGHTLVLVITNSDDDIRIDFPTIGNLISDHYAVKCSLSIFKPSVQVKPKSAYVQS